MLSNACALMHGLDAANDDIRPEMFYNLTIRFPPEWPGGNINSISPIALSLK